MKYSHVFVEKYYKFVFLLTTWVSTANKKGNKCNMLSIVFLITKSFFLAKPCLFQFKIIEPDYCKLDYNKLT